MLHFENTFRRCSYKFCFENTFSRCTIKLRNDHEKSKKNNFTKLCKRKNFAKFTVKKMYQSIF